ENTGQNFAASSLVSFRFLAMVSARSFCRSSRTAISTSSMGVIVTPAGLTWRAAVHPIDRLHTHTNSTRARVFRTRTSREAASAIDVPRGGGAGKDENRRRWQGLAAVAAVARGRPGAADLRRRGDSSAMPWRLPGADREGRVLREALVEPCVGRGGRRRQPLA